MKKHPIPFGIKEMHPPEGPQVKRLLIPSAGDNTDLQEPSYSADGTGKQFLHDLLNLNIYTPMTQLFYFWCIPHMNIAHVPQGTVTRMFMAALLNPSVQQ